MIARLSEKTREH